MNKIEKKDYSEQWDWFTEEVDYEFSEKDHRRGSTFYFTPVYKLDEETAPNNPELHGYWEGDTTTWSDDWGMEDDPEILYRVEIVEEVKVTKTTKRVR